MLQFVVNHTVIHLICKNDNILLHADLCYRLQLFPREHLSDGVVGRVDDDDLCLVGECISEFVDVDRPVSTGRMGDTFFGGMKRDKDSVGALESDRGVVLVKVGFDEDDFVSYFAKGSQGGVHTCEGR